LFKGFFALEVEVRQLCALALTVLIGVYPVSLSSQQTQSAAATTAAVRDPQAIGVLQQALSAAGVTAAAQVRDFTETGNVTYYWAGQEVNGTVTLRGRGTDEFRFDAALSTQSGTQSWAVSDDQGTSQAINGTTTAIPFWNGTNLGQLTIPHLALAAALSDSTMSVTTLGQMTLNGQAVIDIRMQKVFSQKDDPSGELTKWSTRDYVFDPTTYALVEMWDTIYPNDVPARAYLHELIFSNFQIQNGVAIPSSITEKVVGQQTWSIQVSSTTFNTGLTAATFTL
jgi:hypothetical protein